MGGKRAALADPGFLFETGHQIDRVEVAPPRSGADDIGGDGDGQMGLACAGAADQDDVAPCRQERAAVQRTDQPLVIGVPSKWKVSRSFTTGSLAAAIRYRIEAAGGALPPREADRSVSPLSCAGAEDRW